MEDELTSILVSLRPKHTCPGRYKSHMMTSTWIADGCIDSFREQRNMPIKILKKKRKKKGESQVEC
jgi:hypothetical protein